MDVLPAELKSALDEPYGFILLIKGKAGTGKTTLALELLATVKNPIYLSTRVTPKLIYSQFSWIENILPKESIIDATAFDFTQPHSFTDESFFQSLKLRQLPDFVKVLFSKMNSSSGTVVIDSWDAIASLGESNWGKSHSMIANYIIDLVREKNYNLILIEETEEESYLDYLVDGIILLDETFLAGDKLLRHFKLLKLRGICINQPVYLFTLANGRITTFLPTQPPSFKNLEPLKLIKDKNAKISIGIPDLDAILDGGIESGNILLFEIDPPLGPLFSWFVMNTIFNFIQYGRAVIGCPPPERSIEREVQATIKMIGDNELINSVMRILEFGKEKAELAPYVSRIIPKSHLDYFYHIRNLVQDLIEGGARPPALIVLSLNNILFNFDYNEIVKDTIRIISQIKRAGTILFISAKKKDPYIQDLVKVVDSYFVLSQINRKVIFYGISPETNIFAVNFETAGGFFNVKLIPIV